MLPVHPSADNAAGIPNTGLVSHDVDDWGILPEIPRAEFCKPFLNHKSPLGSSIGGIRSNQSFPKIHPPTYIFLYSVFTGKPINDPVIRVFKYQAQSFAIIRVR